MNTTLWTIEAQCIYLGFVLGNAFMLVCVSVAHCYL